MSETFNSDQLLLQVKMRAKFESCI